MAHEVEYLKIKRKNFFLAGLLLIITMSFLIICMFLGITVYLKMANHSNIKNIEMVKIKKENLTEELKIQKKEQETYMEELQQLEDELGNYQPVILPDSMKNNQ